MITEKILARIYGKKRGWCFTPKDFMDLGSPSAIWLSLSRFEKKGTIRKILRGVYEYPQENKFLGGWASPSPEKVAKAIARSCGWTIIPEGNTALNLLGLSTQVPAHWSFLTDGPGRNYQWDGGSLKFLRRSIKETAGLSETSSLIVQSLKALGQDQLDSQIMDKLKKAISAQSWVQAVNDCRFVTTWVYEIIKQIASEVAHV